MNRLVYVNGNKSSCCTCKNAKFCTNQQTKTELERQLEELASKYTYISTTGMVISLGCYHYEPIQLKELTGYDKDIKEKAEAYLLRLKNNIN